MLHCDWRKQISTKMTPEEASGIPEVVEKDRMILIDAAVVRVMKVTVVAYLWIFVQFDMCPVLWLSKLLTSGCSIRRGDDKCGNFCCLPICNERC